MDTTTFSASHTLDQADVSGHTQVDGPTTPVDLERTEQNKTLVAAVVQDVLTDADRVTDDHISTETYKIVGSSDLVAALSRVDSAGTELTIIDLFRVAEGRIFEHWDVREPFPAQEQLVNSGEYQQRGHL